MKYTCRTEAIDQTAGEEPIASDGKSTPIPGVVREDAPFRITDEIPFGIDLADRAHRHCPGQCQYCRCNHGGAVPADESEPACTCTGFTAHRYRPVPGQHRDCMPELGSEGTLIGSWNEAPDGTYSPNAKGDYAAIVNDGYVHVVWSRYRQKVSLCIDRFPGQGDLETEGKFLAYTLPPELWFEEW